MKSTNILHNVVTFTQAVGCTTDVFNVRQTALYTGLQCEELAEKFEAMGMMGRAAELKNIGMAFKRGDLDGYLETADRAALLDADIDLAWVTLGSAASQGANIEGACAEVSRANLDKIGPSGEVEKDGNGKVVKPAGWTPPDLEPFVNTGVAA